MMMICSGRWGVLVRNDQWQVETQAPLVQLFILLKSQAIRKEGTYTILLKLGIALL